MNYTMFLRTARNFHCESGEEETRRYLDTFERRKHFSPSTLDLEFVRWLFEEYLFKWGRMARIYPRIIREDLYQEFLKEVLNIASEFDELANITLISPEFDKYKGSIERVYIRICEIKVPYKNGKRRIGPTSTSKILHFFQPSLFIIWDRKWVREKRHYGETSDQYFKYLKDKQEDLQAILDSYIKTFGGSKIEAMEAIENLHAKDLAEMGYRGFRESITKMLDEVNYYT